MNEGLERLLIAAAMEVHQHLGPGYLEGIYQEALALELQDRDVEYQREVHMPVLYKGKRLHHSFRADLVLGGSLVVELKAGQGLTGKDDVQLRSYLKTTGLTRGVLLNFGLPQLQLKRVRTAEFGMGPVPQ